MGIAALIPRDPFHLVVAALGVVGLFLAVVFAVALKPKGKKSELTTFQAYLKFCWACFFKPHTGDGSGSQQDALVSMEVI